MEKFILIKKLWFHLREKFGAGFYGILALSVFASLCEVLSLGAIIPLISVFTDPQALFKHEIISRLLDVLEVTTSSELRLYVILGFIIALMIALIVRLVTMNLVIRWSYKAGVFIGKDIFEKTLHQPYQVHVNRHSSDIISGASAKSNIVIAGVVLPVVTIISSSIILVFIMLSLLLINPVVMLSVIGLLILAYGFITFVSHGLLKRGSDVIASNTSELVRILQESLGSIKDTIINNTQSYQIDRYIQKDTELRRAQGTVQIISQAPRLVMEAIGMVIIAVYAYNLTSSGADVSKSLGLLAFIAVAAQRILPLLQQIFSSWANIKASTSTLEDVLRLLSQCVDNIGPDADQEQLHFDKNIVISKLFFTYHKADKPVLEDVNLTINQGDRIGFIGQTGSGKSTLIDIIAGLLIPSAGFVSIDSIRLTDANLIGWRKKVAYVPQSIFLSDKSIKENIAASDNPEKIDMDRVMLAAEGAHIASYIESLTEGYATSFGEMGKRLSGGQLQRIGIARALYKNPELIIFDEATSALDMDTERQVMEEIYKLNSNVTIIIIAHRLESLGGCNKIYEISDGAVRLVSDVLGVKE